MYCKNCGNTCNNGETKCSNCGKDLEISYYQVQPVKLEPTYTKEDNDKANLLSAISLLLFLSPFLFAGINAAVKNTALENALSNISGVLGIISFTLMVYVRVKYPKNILAKVLMWLYIAITLLFIICILFVLVSCIAVFSQCAG